MKPRETIAQQLQEIRRQLAVGWTQGAARWRIDDKPWNYCLVGAVAVAVDSMSEDYPRLLDLLAEQIEPEFVPQGGDDLVMQELANMICKHSPEDRLIYWNDRTGRTQAEVLALVDRALTEVTK